MAWAENTGVFFSGLDKCKAVFTKGDLTGEAIGYFDNGNFDPVFGQTEIDTTSPVFTCADKDIPNWVERETLVTIKQDGKADANYSVLLLNPDGTGISAIKLAFE